MGVQYGTVSSVWGTGLNWWGYDKHEAIAGVTLAEAEYPVAITLTGFGIGSYWQNMRNEGTAWGNVYLCDNDNVATSLYMLAVSVRDQATSSEGNGIRYTFSDADGKLLKHKTLGIRLTAPGAVGAYDLGLNGKLSVKVETKLEQVTIKVNSATGGTATASKSIALPGEQITLTVTPSTGYQLKSWTVVSGGITVTNNKFTAGSTNIEITPVWEKIDYTITATASPAEGGTVTAPGTGQYGDTISFSQSPNTGYQLRDWTTSGNVTLGSGSFTMPAGNVRLQANYTKIPYTITQVVEPAGGGVITAPATAGIRDEVEVSQTPSTGYTFSHWELSSGVVKDGKFTMPAAGVTLKAVYIRNAYQITARANPEGAGVITVQETAGYADQVAVSQVPANGYYFNGWTLSSGGSVTNGSFSMPDGAVTVTANYLRRSTATLSTDRLKGGESIRAAIVSEDPAYSHQYRITFPNRGIDSGAIDIPAGTTSLDVPIPKAWAAEETGAATISGGVFTLYTYRGNTLIGSHDTGGLTYQQMRDSTRPGEQISTQADGLRGVSDNTRNRTQQYQDYQQGDRVTQAQQLQSLLNNRPGDYNSKYGQALDNILQQIQNPEKFQYSFNGDEMFKQYADLYTQQGRQASMDAMGQAAGLTGGYGNSYAQQVGNQMYDQYLMQLYDRGNEFRNQAFDEWQAGRADQYNQLNALMQADQNEYNRYRDQMADWQADRGYYTDAEQQAYARDYGEFISPRERRTARARSTRTPWSWCWRTRRNTPGRTEAWTGGKPTRTHGPIRGRNWSRWLSPRR